MSFDSAEISIASGAPLRLYQFTRGTLVWRYSSGDRDVQHQAQLYRAVRGGIEDDGIRQTGQSSADRLTITGPADLEVANLYRAMPPSAEVELTVFGRHAGVDDYVVLWSGGIRSVRWPELDRCSIVCAPLGERIEMVGLRLTWSRACPHALYSAECGVSAALWRVETTVQSMDGAAVSNGALAAYADGYFTAGYLEWSIGGGEFDRRGIEKHSGDTLALLGGSSGLSLGQSIRVYPGCPQTTAGCQFFQGHVLQFGGIPHLPGESPFDGNNYF